MPADERRKHALACKPSATLFLLWGRNLASPISSFGSRTGFDRSVRLRQSGSFVTLLLGNRPASPRELKEAMPLVGTWRR